MRHDQGFLANIVVVAFAACSSWIAIAYDVVYSTKYSDHHSLHVNGYKYISRLPAGTSDYIKQGYIEGIEYYSHFTYFCPGDSVLVKVVADYQKDPPDRRFQFVCRFLEDSGKNPITKNNCAMKASNELTKDAKTFCDANNVLGGLKSTKGRDVPKLDPKNNAEDRDRVFSTQCCTLQDAKLKPVTVNTGSCKTSPESPEKDTWEVSCSALGIANGVITKMETRYAGDDRRYKFTCCKLAGSD